MDQIMMNEGRSELFAVANAMRFPGLPGIGYAPGWTTMNKGPEAKPRSLGFAEKHPNLVLALQLGLAVKALEVRTAATAAHSTVPPTDVPQCLLAGAVRV